MKPTEKQRNEIKRYVNKWRPKLFLGEWFFNTNFAVEDSGAAATVKVDYVYLRADIMVFPCFWKHCQKEREEIIVHEMCHCISEEMYQASVQMANGFLVTANDAQDRRERLTQRITNIAFEW